MWIDRACRRVVFNGTIGRTFSLQAASPLGGSPKVDRMVGSRTGSRGWSSGAVVDGHSSSATRHVDAGGWRISAGAVGRKPEMRTQKCYYSSAAAGANRPGAPIQLESERFEPPPNPLFPPPRSPIIILHGLFGSKQNWRSLAKRLSHATHRVVYTLDLRNHGESQATPGFTSYLDYASDVKEFIKRHSLKKVILIGHSMGGKVAMTLALESTISSTDEDGLIEKLVAVDISPAKGPISKSFQDYIDGFKEVNSSAVSSRKQADEILAKYEQDLGRRQFLLTNLKQVERGDGGGTRYKIRLPVEVLEEQLANNHVGDFPFEPSGEADGVRFDKPSLFIKGARSKYINKYNIPTIAAFFGNHQLVVLDTDHWVHAEKPNEFVSVVVNFVQS